LWPQRNRQDDVGGDRRREEEDETEHDGEPHDDRLDPDVVGDPGAHAGENAPIRVAPQTMARAGAVGPYPRSLSCAHAPARRIAVEHLFERLDAPFHLPRALPEIAERLLVVAGQSARLPPLRCVVTNDPDRRDDDQKQNAEDKKSSVEEHGVLPLLAW